MTKLKKLSNDKLDDLIGYPKVDDVNRDTAILFINGEIIEDRMHSFALNTWLTNHEKDKQLDSPIRPGESKIQELTNTDNLPIAFAHLCMTLDGEDVILLERDTLQNCDANTVVTALKQKYNLPVYLFDNGSNTDYLKKVANKSLKKTEAELYKKTDENIIIYKNPTIEEIEECKKDSNKVRGLITYDGQIYCWDGNYSHALVIKYIDINNFRFAYEGQSNRWVMDGNYDFTLDELKQYIVTLKNTLSKFGNLNIPIYIYNTEKNLEEYNTNRIQFANINDLEDDIEINKKNKEKYEDDNFIEI